MSPADLEALKSMTRSQVDWKYTGMVIKEQATEADKLKALALWDSLQSPHVDLQDPWGKKTHDWSEVDIKTLTAQFKKPI